MNPTWVVLGLAFFLVAMAVKFAVLVGIAVAAAKAVPDEPSSDRVRVTRLYEPNDASRTGS